MANLVGFAPPKAPANYTARFMSRPTGRAVGETLFVVRRVNNWIRIDEHHEDRSGSIFINLATELVVRTGAETRPGRPRSFSVSPLTERPWKGEGRLVSLRRGGVRQVDVSPPANLFVLETWTADVSFAPDAPNYEVVLQSEDPSHPKTVIERRRGSLTYQEVFSRAQRDLKIDDQKGLNFSASYTLDGRLIRLSVSADAHGGIQPEPEEGGETILGEDCRWVDNARRLSDYTSKSCLAADGAPLMTFSASGWGGGPRRSIATEVSRKPLPLTALLPPQQAFTSLRP